MGFLGIGAMEALVILVIALIIFGPGRLPEIMGEAGRTVRDFRRATRDLTGDFQDSISEVRGTYRELEEEMRGTASDLRRDAQKMADEVNTAVSDASTLGDTNSSAANRRRPTPKLDQMVDPESDPINVAEFPSEKTSNSKEKVASGPGSNAAKSSPTNGAVAKDDDLLSMDDGDDLLAVDERN
ncbi:MAG: twin-arginine translocase TatA/TatE family subunit [Thermomicrobiales bacterium]